MEKKVISVAEYAKIRGVSVTAVYNRLKTTLNPYLTEDEKGRKCLKIEVLEAEGLEKESKMEESEVEKDSKPVENVENTVENPLLKGLKEQLAEKERRIQELEKENARLQSVVEENNKQLLEQSNKLIELIEQSNRLAASAHILLAEKKKEQNQTPIFIEEESKGFFKRLFTKKKKQG